ncbi:MAG TPA: ABC transporter permease [Opitutaceae bacterium]|nr:ABC transporter permease [Opitutaceae bacterium]
MIADLRFALRQLAKAPSFTIVALMTLALGLGSATVVFSAVNALLLKPLPLVGDAEDRLVYLSQTHTARGQQNNGWNYLDFADLRARMTGLEGMWVHADLTVILTGKHLPRRLWGVEITWDAFALMGVPPLHGRLFNADDAKPGAPNVALISHDLWRGQFGGDPGVVDTTITLQGRPTTIVGVMPPLWRYPDFTDLWMPMRPEGSKMMSRGYYSFSGRGLLKPGVTLEDAQIEASTIMAALAHEHPDTNTGIGVKVRPIREEAAEDIVHLTLLLFCAVMFVFLIACVNVANLLLARAVTRSKEISIRLALGAERHRVVRQLVTENLVLALCGGVLGLVLALWANDAIIALIPPSAKPFWLRFDFDGRVFLFVFVLSSLSALLFGLIPALKASRPDLVTELKEGGRTAESGGPRATRLRNLLVIVEVALALVLLVGAGLMMRSFLHLRAVHPGFDPSRVLTFRTGFPVAMAASGVAERFFADLVPKLAALPGVESAGLVSTAPGLRGDSGHVRIEGRAEGKHPADLAPVYARLASPGYFSTVRIPLVAGRGFDPALDRADTPRVALVDETFALRYFGGDQAAVGKRFRFAVNDDDKPAGWIEIVGVVGNIRHQLDRDEVHPTVYQPVSQETAFFLTAVLRTTGDPAGHVEAAREAVLSVNSSIPIYHELPLETVLRRTIWPREFFSFLFTMFGLVALLLACVGIYGVMAYNVTQRTQEIGVRMALGAQSAEVVRMVVRRGLRLVGWGLGAGIAAAFVLANLLTSVLYGVSPHDPPTFAVVPVLLAAVALLACWLPARRATLVNPGEAIRLE